MILAHKKSVNRILDHAAGFFAAGGIILGGLAFSGCETGANGPAADPDAQIIITHPVGGETFYVNDSLHVKWALQGAGYTDVSSINIELSLDSGKTFATILGRSIAIGEPGFGDYAWKIPATILKSGAALPLAGLRNLLFRVKEYNPSSPDQVAVMKKPFSISTR
jgi:hypothetical protein